MPELPEVESIRRYLVERGIEGTRIERVEIGWADSVAAPRNDIEGFANEVAGAQIGTISRRGKYLIMPLITPLLRPSTSPMHLVLHMGMTGSLHIRSTNAVPVRHRRAMLCLDDERSIELNDSRRWARLWCVDDPIKAFPTLGPEPWDLTAEQFAVRMRLRRARIKPTLLDQSLIAGVGNIYADESLHRSGISPLRQCNRVSVSRLMHLHTAIVAVLNHAIEFISSHPNGDGSPYVVDAHDERMRLQRVAASICPKCGTILTSIRIAGRTAYYCRQCQR